MIIDSSAWSVALRRRVQASLAEREARVQEAVVDAVSAGRAVLIGLVRQELLSGVGHPDRFRRLRDALRAFADEPLETADHERAAEMFNRCRAVGLQGSVVDFLICALAERLDAQVLTLDRDFEGFASVLDVRLVPLGQDQRSG